VIEAGAAGTRAGSPRHVPRGVRPALDDLLGLRRYGGAMRRFFALDEDVREGWRSVAPRSQGMDYAESRPYTPGDDVRRIDWRVTARTGRAHTKIFRPERGGDLACLVDLRAPMRFGTRAAFKSVVAAHLGALAGWAAAAGGERFGACLAGASAWRLPAGPAQSTAAALCALLAAQEAGGEASLERLAARAASEAAAGTRFVVISDFAEAGDSLERVLRPLRARGAVVLVCVRDEFEEKLPPPARYPLTDGESLLTLDAASARVRDAHARDAQARRARLLALAARPGTRCRFVGTGEDLLALAGAA
jgi:uncharacterized protein (DUF58 family)